MKTLEFYFDFGSPYSYIAHRRLPAVLKRTGATLALRPVLLGGVFQMTGNQSPAALEFKRPEQKRDFARHAKRYGFEFRMNPFFIVNTLKLMRGAVAAERAGELERYAETMFSGMWVEEKNLAEDAVIAEVLSKAGFDAARYAAAINDPAVKDELKARTAAAVERGLFGVPTFFVGEEMFFGQDRLDFVEDALKP